MTGTVADLDASRRVYHTSRTGGGEGRSRAHLDEHCRALDKATSVYQRLAEHLDPDMPICRVCIGDLDLGPDEGVNPRALANRLESMDPDEIGAETGGAP